MVTKFLNHPMFLWLANSDINTVSDRSALKRSSYRFKKLIVRNFGPFSVSALVCTIWYFQHNGISYPDDKEAKEQSLLQPGKFSYCDYFWVSLITTFKYMCISIQTLLCCCMSLSISSVLFCWLIFSLRWCDTNQCSLRCELCKWLSSSGRQSGESHLPKRIYGVVPENAQGKTDVKRNGRLVQAKVPLNVTFLIVMVINQLSYMIVFF